MPVWTKADTSRCPKARWKCGEEALSVTLSARAAWHRRPAIQGDQLISQGVPGQPRHRVNVEPAHDSFPVRLDGPHTDLELIGDFLIAQSFRDADQNLAFPAVSWEKGGFFPGLTTNSVSAVRITSSLKKASPACTASMARASSSGGASFDTYP